MSVEKEIPISNTTSEGPPDTQGGVSGGESRSVEDSPGENTPTPPSAGEELEKLRKEKEEIYDLYLRKQAEVENYKKRLQREKAESIRYANESLINELLPVIDNFELAISAIYNINNEDETLSHNEGIKLILKQLRDVLGKYDLTDVPTVGQPFDPAHHEAVMQKPSAEHPPNTVMEEHRKGYKLKGKLIRPAMVVVSKKEEEVLSDAGEGPNG